MIDRQRFIQTPIKPIRPSGVDVIGRASSQNIIEKNGGKMGGAITTALLFVLVLFTIGVLGFMFGDLD